MVDGEQELFLSNTSNIDILSDETQEFFRKWYGIEVKPYTPLERNPITFEPNFKEGVKFDVNKTRYDLIPPEFLEGTAKILTFGANKYGVRNWEKGMSWGRVFGALMRHMWAWWRREDNDPETNKSHLWHAACCIMFLLTFEARGRKDLDDRPNS